MSQTARDALEPAVPKPCITCPHQEARFGHYYWCKMWVRYFWMERIDLDGNHQEAEIVACSI